LSQRRARARPARGAHWLGSHRHARLGLAAAGSLAVGWAVGRAIVAAFAVLAIPFSVPFGYADEYLGSDAPQVWWFGVMAALISAVLVLLTVWIERRVTAPRPRT
jgi:hypothetical protein